MAWKPNFPQAQARGVTVSARKGFGAAPYVMVTLWPDVLAELGWERGLLVDVLEGFGEDAGRIRIEPNLRAKAASGSVRQLKAAGTRGEGKCLQVPVSWPAYAWPFGAVQAQFKCSPEEDWLIITMPEPPPAETGDAAVENLPARVISEVCVVCDPPVAGDDQDADGADDLQADDLAPPEFSPEAHRLREIADTLTGTAHRYLTAFLARRVLSWGDLQALHDQEVSNNTMRLTLAALRRKIEFAGWSLEERGPKVELRYTPPAQPAPAPPPPRVPAPPAPGVQVPDGAPDWLKPALEACKSAKGRLVLMKLANEGSVTLQGVIYAFSPPIKEGYASVLVSEVRRALEEAGWSLPHDPVSGYAVHRKAQRAGA